MSAVLVAGVAGSVLLGCGGSGTSSDSDSTSTPSTVAEHVPPQIRNVDGSAIGAPPLEVSPGGAAQFSVKGNGYRYKKFGREGTRSELVAAAESVRAFHIVLAEEKWKEACSFLSKAAIENVESLAKSTSANTCGGILDAITAPFTKKAARETAVLDAGALRRDKEEGAYLLYYGAGKAVYSIPMSREGGVWKVAGVGATLLN